MDDKKLYNSSREKFKPILKKMVWNKQVKNWLDWDSLFNANTFPMIGSETKTYNDFLRIIKKNESYFVKKYIF